MAIDGHGPDRSRPERVSVCVITYRRPEGLERLLEGLERLEFRGAAPELRVVVVDNDPEASARGVCEPWRARLPWPLHYEVEPRRGIPFARNRTVEIALRQGADFLAFIDDDEVPEPGWMDELLRVQRAYAADVVAGPVLPRFESSVPPWIQQGGFLEERSPVTGQRLEVAGTGNALVGAHVFREITPPFDESMALSGGSDGHFFRRVTERGYLLVWAEEARAHEHVPDSRATVRWVLQRAYRIGLCRCLFDMDADASPRARLSRVGRALARSLQHGAAGMLSLLLHGRARSLRHARSLAYRLGYVAAELGLRSSEYRITHGR